MDPEDLPDRIAGLRAVRIVAAGDRARLVLLQHPDGVLARIWHAHVARSEIDRELAAMTRVAHPHLLHPLDVETLEDGRVVALVPRVGRGSVQRLLDARSTLAYGEAVTLGAPVAAAVEALHTGGVRLAGIAAGRILLSDAGAPVVVGFGRAELFERGLAAAAREERVVADLAELRRFLLLLVSRVDPEDARRDRALAALERVPDVDLPSAAGRILFEQGGAIPVLFPGAELTGPRGLPALPGSGRVGISTGSLPRIEKFDPPPERASRVVRMLDRGAAGARQVVWERWTALPRVRRLLVLGGAAAVATALCAAVLVPAGAPAVQAVDGPSASVSPEPTPSAARGADPGAARTDPASAAVRGSDPLAASVVLMPARESRIRDGDARGLAEIDETGSALLTADVAVTEGRGVPVLPDPPYSLVQALGDAVLIASPSARILMVDTPDGWRVREVTPTDEDGG